MASQDQPLQFPYPFTHPPRSLPGPPPGRPREVDEPEKPRIGPHVLEWLLRAKAELRALPEADGEGTPPQGGLHADERGKHYGRSRKNEGQGLEYCHDDDAKGPPVCKNPRSGRGSSHNGSCKEQRKHFSCGGGELGEHVVGSLLHLDVTLNAPGETPLAPGPSDTTKECREGDVGLLEEAMLDELGFFPVSSFEWSDRDDDGVPVFLSGEGSGFLDKRQPSGETDQTSSEKRPLQIPISERNLPSGSGQNIAQVEDGSASAGAADSGGGMGGGAPAVASVAIGSASSAGRQRPPTVVSASSPGAAETPLWPCAGCASEVSSALHETSPLISLPQANTCLPLPGERSTPASPHGCGGPAPHFSPLAYQVSPRGHSGAPKGPPVKAADLPLSPGPQGRPYRPANSKLKGQRAAAAASDSEAAEVWEGTEASAALLPAPQESFAARVRRAALQKQQQQQQQQQHIQFQHQHQRQVSQQQLHQQNCSFQVNSSAYMQQQLLLRGNFSSEIQEQLDGPLCFTALSPTRPRVKHRPCSLGDWLGPGC
ncbi:polyglutamine-repeat protein pqn-41 [Cyclospora cayetanensis]|uniref:Polyglutamine-repeat protein pqn-41 n=1 Tax=Cyclospora cayetanensis TaxID=88456 RepID=A0A6P6RU09_9EIME|nr:polyglutamine-repeat protein pqn-41 [Cyclospora cayetanensis]